METADTRAGREAVDLPALLPGDAAVRTARVLLVEDDEQSPSMLERMLERHGHKTVSSRTGRDALRTLLRERPDLVLLTDSPVTLERMRDMTDVPIIVVGSRGTEEDAVATLRAGADDYVTKPYGVQELLARVDALLRRARPAAAPPKRYADAVLELDYGSLDVRIAGEPIALTALQLRVLAALVEHNGKVLSAQQILRLAWGDDLAPRARVKLYVGYLREKFRERGVEPPIETVRGFGYRYVPPA